eukprot:2132933-Prymnesium_polylepis.2
MPSPSALGRHSFSRSSEISSGATPGTCAAQNWRTAVSSKPGPPPSDTTRNGRVDLAAALDALDALAPAAAAAAVSAAGWNLVKNPTLCARCSAAQPSVKRWIDLRRRYSAWGTIKQSACTQERLKTCLDRLEAQGYSAWGALLNSALSRGVRARACSPRCEASLAALTNLAALPHTGSTRRTLPQYGSHLQPEVGIVLL